MIGEAARGEWLIGVHWDKRSEKFQAQCGNPFTKKLEYLGYFTCEVEAHQAWKKKIRASLRIGSNPSRSTSFQSAD